MAMQSCLLLNDGRGCGKLMKGHRYLVPCPVQGPPGFHAALYERLFYVVVPYPHQLTPRCHHDKAQCVIVGHKELMEFYLLTYIINSVMRQI